MSKYSKELTLEICGYLEDGLTQKDAAILAQISTETFHAWLKDEKKPEFSEAIKAAKIKNKQYHLNNIKKAGVKSWQASAWYLERVYQSEFAIKKEEQKQPITIQWEEVKLKKTDAA